MNMKLFSDRELQRMFCITETKLIELIRNCYKIRTFLNVLSRYISVFLLILKYNMNLFL
jgi:hypothetical protein